MPLEGRSQFTFYRSYYEALRMLPEESRYGVLEAVFGYALDGIEPDGLDIVQRMAFMLIKPTLDSGWKKARAGKQGGIIAKAPGKQQVSKKESKIEIELEKELEVEIESELEKELEIEIEDECLLRESFESFWEIYPVKLGKEQAFDEWVMLRPDALTVCNAVRQWLASRQWRQENGRFIPRAARFLRERHFEAVPQEEKGIVPCGVLGQAELEAIQRIMEEP